MAAMAMPRDAGDDLHIYMRQIIDEDFPKALRQAFNTLWDKKYARQYGPLDGSYHWSRQFDALENNFYPLMFSTGSQFALDPVSSKSFEELDFDELCRILTNLRFLKVQGCVPENSNLWSSLFESTNPEISNIDEGSFLTAVYQLMELNQQHINCEGRMNSQLLKRQLAQARRVFTALGVTLNDSKNAIAFSAAGLQDLILEWRKMESSHPPFIFPELDYFQLGAFSSEQERRDFKIWIKGKYLGGGNFGKVFSLTHRESGIRVAMKEVKMEPKYSKMPEEVKQLQNEIDKLSRLRHRRIVRFHGSEQKGEVIYLFLDFMAGGSLHEFIKQRGKLDERLTREFTQQILEGVDYLHSNEITHRDIKGPNILLDSGGSVKLADFGVSRTIQKIGTKTDLTSYVGTPYWMAPEILWGKGYGRKVDIWSVGCTVVEMLTGDPPLKHLEPPAATFHIGTKPLEVELPEGVTKEARDFVLTALTWLPDNRPHCKQLLTHPFVNMTPVPLHCFQWW